MKDESTAPFPTTNPASSLNRDNKKTRGHFRLGCLVIFLVLFFVKQFRRPLEQYSGVEIIFKTPIGLRPYSDEVLQQRRDANDFSELHHTIIHTMEVDEDLDESHDSHDALVQELTPVAMILMQDYQYHHSNFWMQHEAFDCRERTNAQDEESLADAIHQGWCPELQKRHFLVVTLDCNKDDDRDPIESLQDFLRSIAWAMATGKTPLYKKAKDGDSLCDEMAQVDAWLPRLDEWNDEYEWFKKGQEPNIPVVDISKIEHDKTHNLITLNRPPPLSLDYLETLSSQRKGEQLMEWGMSYGMILDETIVMYDEPEIIHDESNSSIEKRTHRYAIQASAQPDKCPMNFESPCVIYQVGPEPVKSSSECEVETTSTMGELSGNKKRTMFETLAKAGSALHGVVLDKKSHLSALLVELLNYRGRLARVDYKLYGCFQEETGTRRQFLR